MSVCVVGSINLDLVTRVSRLPRAGETVMASTLSRFVGGKGANQAVAAARAGAAVRMIGRVGRDDSGGFLLDYLRRAGVDVEGVGVDDQTPTGQAFITVADDAENTIVVVAGANARLLPHAAASAPREGAGVLLAQLETDLGPISALFSGPASGWIRMLNAAPAIDQGRSLFVDSDIIVLNETELDHYGGRPDGLHDDDRGSLERIADGARTLLSRADQSVVVTLGAQGVVLVDAADWVHIPGLAVPVVDTVGAGDCFCGVLAASLDQGLSLRAAAERANLAAAIAVGRPGAADAMPARDEIDAMELARGRGPEHEKSTRP